MNGPRKRLPPPQQPEPVDAAERVARALDALAEVHREGALAGWCVECMVAWPCHTRVIVDEAREAVRS